MESASLQGLQLQGSNFTVPADSSKYFICTEPQWNYSGNFLENTKTKY